MHASLLVLKTKIIFYTNKKKSVKFKFVRAILSQLLCISWKDSADDAAAPRLNSASLSKTYYEVYIAIFDQSHSSELLYSWCRLEIWINGDSNLNWQYTVN